MRHHADPQIVTWPFLAPGRFFTIPTLFIYLFLCS